MLSAFAGSPRFTRAECWPIARLRACPACGEVVAVPHLHDAPGCGSERDGEEGSGDSADGRARGDDDEHDEGMEADRLAHQDRLQDVPFELIDDDDDEHDECRGERSVADEGDQGGDGARAHGADDRDEGEQEGEDREWYREGDLQDEQADEDSHGVEQCGGGGAGM